MRTFAQTPKAARQIPAARSARPGRGRVGQSPVVGSILHLQRTSGNQAVQRMLQARAGAFDPIPGQARSPASLQAKLTVGSPGDRYEQEADRVAAVVTGMAEPGVQRACGGGGSCASPVAPGLELLQAKTAGTGEPGTSVAPRAVHDALGSTGQPLEAGTRSFFEPRFGRDFSQVRIHTGSDAAKAAQAVNALAFTVGPDIYFGAGAYRPHHRAGRTVLAHELTHVVQQGGNQQTLMRTCDCARIGGRPPDPAIPLEAAVGPAFPGLVSGDWCVIGPTTPNYNCFAWSVSDTTQWIDMQVDSVYGDNDGQLSFADFDAFYEQTQGLQPQTAPDSNTLVALFASGGVPQHAALTAVTESCGSVPFTSKLGAGPLIAHDLNQLEGGLYGTVERYYG